ncbi:MAG TPA: hypothetical protein VF791_17570 [Pyrinomonadaceae bacterium]
MSKSKNLEKKDSCNRLISLTRLSPRTVIIAALVMATVSGLAMGMRVWSRTASANEVQERKVERVVIRSTGFEPAEITRPAGPFALSFDNQSGVEEIVLRLNREDGTQVREIAIPRGVGNWGAQVDLPVGTYTLTEANHAEWSCRIIVQ